MKAINTELQIVHKLFLLLLFISLTKITVGQIDENPLPFVAPEPVYDTAPRFPGGPDRLMKYFNDSIRYPEPERMKRIEGDVLVKFSVSEEGKVKNVRVINGVPGGANLAREAERVMDAMPTWIPASKEGKPVEAESTLAVPFRLSRH